MSRCEKCGSRAINEHLHGRRKGHKSDMCDVCYWRSECERLLESINRLHCRVAPLLRAYKRIGGSHLDSIRQSMAECVMDAIGIPEEYSKREDE